MRQTPLFLGADDLIVRTPKVRNKNAGKRLLKKSVISALHS